MEELQRPPRWNFPLAKWKKSSPSRDAGMSFEEELIWQAKGVQFIGRMAMHLRLPQQTIFTAALYVHRFYTRQPLQQFHSYKMAAGCMFLACKTEETPRKLKDVAVAATKAALKLPKTVNAEKDHADDVEQWRRLIPSQEDELLQLLKFDFDFGSPYEHLDKLLRQYVPKSNMNQLGTMAAGFITDSTRTLLPVEAGTLAIATAALYWASKAAHIAIPVNDGHKWYSDVESRQSIVQYINDMAEMTAILTKKGVISEGQKYEQMQ